jgi:hypothetical protein
LSAAPEALQDGPAQDAGECAGECPGPMQRLLCCIECYHSTAPPYNCPPPVCDAQLLASSGRMSCTGSSTATLCRFWVHAGLPIPMRPGLVCSACCVSPLAPLTSCLPCAVQALLMCCWTRPMQLLQQLTSRWRGC